MSGIEHLYTCLCPISLRSFSEVLSYSLVWNIYSPMSSFCLVVCVCFYVVSDTAASLSLEGVALWRWWPMWLRTQFIPWSHHHYQLFKGHPLCGLYVPSGYGWWVQSMPSGPYRLKRDDQNGTHQDFCFWRRSQEFLASPAVAFRLIRGSSSHIYGLAFQIVALALNSGVNLCA